MTKQRMNYYKKIATTAVNVQVKTESLYRSYYRGLITLAEHEKELATIISNFRNSDLIISCMFAVIARKPSANNFQEVIDDVFTVEIKTYVERLERIRMERELQELRNTLAG